MKFLRFSSFVAAAVLFGLTMASAPAQTATPSASPDAAGQTIPIDGVNVTIHDIAVLFADTISLYAPIKDAPVKGIVFTKAASEMPPLDPQWHLVGSEMKDGKPQITVWILNSLPKSDAVEAMQAVGVLGILDQGLGGDSWQAIYAKAKAADTAAGPTAKDPWEHRKDLASRVAAMFMAIAAK